MQNNEILLILDKINDIQSQYNFKIPLYILDEIVLENYCKQNLNMLINLAVMNNRLSKSNSKILKKVFCK